MVKGAENKKILIEEYTILLPKDLRLYWMEMKGKLNFRDDISFIWFLLHLAKNELNATRYVL